MRGEDQRTGSLFSYVDLEARVGKDHPLRAIRLLVNEALAALAGEFSGSTRRLAARRSRRRSCCGQCCCKRSIRSARSAS
jgi:hypothetical protein